ncbi:PDR/VanB family oxidoreductase [Pigmentiphaga kullae]|uniref:Ferredoxin--NADP+ reductase n=1 Tax=Pigmentiphaga kullae TaxID=151784 RepID=A0A4Q7NN17_9BURK|nr:PDR/VanB family oxidoreductase [Pigmentiphaga kullae]RZS86611.1 ferredoxin--NADP+ reductase [Pigmentiphaga kullae]
MNSSARTTVVVHAIRLEAEGIVSVELRAVLGESLPRFSAGAHLDLHLPNDMVRSYSLCSSPADRSRYVVGVMNDRKSRGGSRYIHEHLRVGSRIDISGPRNHFELDEGAKSSVLVAGGIGVTPILCMFDRLRDIGRPVELIYCARSRRVAAFVTELSMSDSPVTLHFDDETGHAARLPELLKGRDSDAHYYCCGPAPMLEAFEAACRDLGYANVHIERFAAADEVESSQKSGYDVHLKQSGRTLNVFPGIVLLDALLDVGIDLPYSCREGICGACEVKVLEGTPDHRDFILSERERTDGKVMMPCVSGCRGAALTLDL